MFKNRVAYFAIVLSGLTSVTMAFAKYKIDKPSISFHAHGPGGLKIDGKSSSLKIDEDEKTVTFKTFMNTLDTGIGMRNDHMQKRFKAGDYPEITLTVPKDKANPKAGGSTPASLTLHGQTRPVTVRYKVDGNHIDATFDVNLNNHGITDEDLCELGVCAKPDVAVEVRFDLSE
jgi:polyisoprenoid-binding protein YceI